MATVNIDGDASGAVAACAAAQGAIDALHGKTVNVDINVRDHGGAGGMGAATRGMQDFSNAADRASRSTRGMGDDLGRAGTHMGRMANDAGRLRDHLSAVDGILRGGAPSSIGRSSAGMRELADHADRAKGSIGELSQLKDLDAIAGGTGRAGQGMREIGAGARASHEQVTRLADAVQKAASTFSVASSGRVGGDAGSASRLGFGDQTGTRASNFAVDSAGNVSSRLSGASKEMERFTGSAAGMGSALGGSGKEMERFGDRAGEMERHVASAGRTIDATERKIAPLGRGLSGGDLGMMGLKNELAGIGSALSPVLGVLNGVGPSAAAAAKSVIGLGLAGGVSAIGMGALGAAVAGVGLAGVAEDFRHNSQLMHAGEQAVRGFNREFSAMKAETTAAGSGPMAGVASSMKGVGHELAAIGAANIAPVLNDVASLGNQATAAMQKLAPSIGPATQGLTALAGAVIGAFGNSGPAVTSFANTITQNAPGLQKFAEGAIGMMSDIGSAFVETAVNLPPAILGDTSVAGAASDAGSNAGSWTSKVSDFIAHPFGGKGPSLLSAHPAGSADVFGPGADGDRASAPVAPGQFDPSKPFSGMLPDGKGGFTPGTGDGAAPKPPRAARSWGNFGPGSGGPATPPGPTGAQIYDQQYTQATGAPSGQPHYSGVGPRGPGQSVGPMPVNAAIGLGGGGIQPFNQMMQAAQSQVAGGGASTGTAMVQHIQKAVQTAAPAATAGGASLGAGMNTGMAQGSNQTQNVIDTVTIKHTKRVIDLASAILGVHSPSTEFDYLGRMTSAGYAQGIERESHRPANAIAGSFGQLGSKFSPDYQGAVGPSISIRRAQAKAGDGDANQQPPTFEQVQQAQRDAADRKASFGTQQGVYKPGSEGWWSAHDNRAGELAAGREDRQRAAIGGMTHDERRDQLLQNRANNRERALNLGDRGRQLRMATNVNPFAGTPGDPVAADQNRAMSRVINPFSQLPGMFNKAGQNSVQGLTSGMTAHVGKAEAAGVAVASAAQGGHKKKDRSASPSAAWFDMAGNSVAGLVGGMAAGRPALAAAGAGMASAMQAATAGPMADSGLAVGYTWAQNMETGISTQIKKSNYQAQGLPGGLGQAGLLGLAATGLLTAGSGAQSYKTPGNVPGVVTLPAPQPVTIVMQPQHVVLDGQVIATITQQQFSGFLDQMTGAISLQPTV